MFWAGSSKGSTRGLLRYFHASLRPTIGFSRVHTVSPWGVMSAAAMRGDGWDGERVTSGTRVRNALHLYLSQGEPRVRGSLHHSPPYTTCLPPGPRASKVG